MQAVWDKVFGPPSQFNNTSTVKVSETSKGFSWHAVSGGSGSQPEAGPFEVQSVQDDYITVFDYDAAMDTSGSAPIYLAKEWKHQNSLLSEMIFGVAHNYTYQPGLAPPGGLNPADVNNVFRTDTYSGTPEYQRITPPWVCGPGVGEIVFAFSAGLNLQAADGTAISLMLRGRSCQWSVVDS